MISKRERRVKVVGIFGTAALCSFAAMSLFSTAAHADPYAEGIDFYQKRNFARAASCFETVIARSSEQTNAIYYAALYQQLRNNARAIELYTTLATRYPRSQAGQMRHSGFENAFSWSH